jgi:hypothetical protein
MSVGYAVMAGGIVTGLWVSVLMGCWYALRMAIQQSQAQDIIVNPESSRSLVVKAWSSLYGP